MRGALLRLASLLLLGGCPIDEDTGPQGPTAPVGCSSGGVIDPEPTSSMFDEISVSGTVNLGNCDGAIDPATVTVINLTTGAAGSGMASDPYCAAFFREYNISARAPLRSGANVIEVRVVAGPWRACEALEITCTPCDSRPPPPDAGIAHDAATDAAP